MPALGLLDRSAARPLFGAGGQEHLELGVREDDGADVTTLDDDVVGPAEVPLLGDHRLANDAAAGRPH